MGSIKNVVKVMNFHSLLRVDKARKKAENYLKVGNEITKILSEILYNKNIVLDKETLTPNQVYMAGHALPIMDSRIPMSPKEKKIRIRSAVTAMV